MIPLILPAILMLPYTLMAAESGTQTCIGCHREKTPAAVSQWEESVHGKQGIGCEACHGSDHEAIVRGERTVTQTACAPCHRKEYEEHRKSRHGMGLHTGWGCTRNLPDRRETECRFCHERGSEAPLSTASCPRFLKQSESMREMGCNGCHRVENSCASCHTNHMTDLSIVRDPASCARCHMGPDHPQWEMWQTSQHGTLYGRLGEKRAPDCRGCHMPGKSHDVSRGITTSSAGIPLPAETAKREREFMIGICTGCHSPSFSRRSLERADAILKESLALVKEAEETVWELYDLSLLDPMPERRPPHPTAGHRLVTDSGMLYEDVSPIERLLFTMKKYDYAKTIKGAYHQNPAYTHWYGNAELKMKLVDIKGEAGRLRKLGSIPPPSPSIPEELTLLKGKLERGVIDRQEYEQRKRRLLERLR